MNLEELTEALHEVQQAHTNENSNLQLAEARCDRLTEALALQTDRGDDWQAIAERDLKRAEAAEQKLAAAEKERDFFDTERMKVVESLEAAEARCRELEAEHARLLRKSADNFTAKKAAESELAQLRAELSKRGG